VKYHEEVEPYDKITAVNSKQNNESYAPPEK
jgi:hypothetical protein